MDIVISLLIVCLFLCGLHTILLHDIVEIESSRSDLLCSRNMFNIKHSKSVFGERKTGNSNVSNSNDNEEFTFFKTIPGTEKNANKRNAPLAWNFGSRKHQDTDQASIVFGFNKKKRMAAFRKRPNGSAVIMVSRDLLSLLVCILVLKAKCAQYTECKLTIDLQTLALTKGTLLEQVYFGAQKINEIYSSFWGTEKDEASYDSYYHLMKLPFEFSKRHLNNFTSYSLSVFESNRLASYRNLPLGHLPQTLSVLRLADGGFSYKGTDNLVQCDVCSNEVRIHTFMSGEFMLDPKDAMFHREQCSTLTVGSSSSMNNNQSIFNNSSSPSRTETAENIQSMDSLESDSSNIDTGSTESDIKEFNVTSDQVTRRFVNKDFTHTGDNLNTLSAQDISNSSAVIAAVALPVLKGQEAACDDGYISDDPNFIDSKLFNQEHANGNDQKSHEDLRRPMQSLECKKNPGHFAYFPLISLIPGQLPQKMRNRDFLEFLQCFGALTVRIVVRTTSRQRHRNDSALKDPCNDRYGTGWVSLHDSPLREGAHSSSEKGKWRTVKKYVKTLVKKSADRVFVTTHRHIVFDDSEAESTTVEFFFDEPGRKHVKFIKCVAMKHSGKTGDNQVVLECKTSDQEFLARLQGIRQRLPELLEKIPRKIKELMRKKLFIIHHPHGREKQLSYGDAVVVKYRIEKSKEGSSQMIKVNNQTQEGDVRKVLLYAADTCPGTSGAPVLTFQRGPVDASGQPSYHLDIWVHNGEEKNNKLGGASMKELTSEDLQPALSQQNDTVEEDSDEDDASLGNQKVSAPSMKVSAPPANPDYAPFDTRLDSFGQAKEPLIHSHVYFARAGFYYGGYADCVKCFCCGVGLKSWKHGDNVYEQHLKHRPGCRYLLSQMKHGEPYPDDQWAVNTGETSQREEKAETLKLLHSENKKLKSTLVCKVCSKEPVRDLFLPCGDLYTCTGCSKLLTHCPSCNKQIMATVTTYLT